MWLACRLNHLALAAARRGHADATQPLAVIEPQGNRQLVMDCNRAAANLGVQANMPLRAACSLVPELTTLPRQPAAEQRCLQHLASWLYQFSSRVSLCPPALIELEIKASRRLFGGDQALARMIGKRLIKLGFTASLAIAPTPAAARLFSLDQPRLRIVPAADLNAAIDASPIAHSELAPALITTLERIGLHRLGQLQQLPRDSVARRYGAECLNYLDRLYGRVAEEPTSFHPPQDYHSLLELPCEVQHAEGLLFALQRLLRELCHALEGGDRSVNQIEWRFNHVDHAPTRLTTGLQTPTQDEAALLSLLKEQLVHLQLPAPVREIEIRAPRMLAAQPQTMNLFEDPQSRQWPDVMERLRARLGSDAVRQLAVVDDHRPERAWGYRSDLRQTSLPPPTPERPLWLLPHPTRLAQPPQRLHHPPERIECGWWEQDDVRRDYFQASDPHGRRLWVFRDRRSGAWYLHGVW